MRCQMTGVCQVSQSVMVIDMRRWHLLCTTSVRRARETVALSLVMIRITFSRGHIPSFG